MRTLIWVLKGCQVVDALGWTCLVIDAHLTWHVNIFISSGSGYINKHYFKYNCSCTCTLHFDTKTASYNKDKQRLLLKMSTEMWLQASLCNYSTVHAGLTPDFREVIICKSLSKNCVYFKQKVDTHVFGQNSSKELLISWLHSAEQRNYGLPWCMAWPAVHKDSCWCKKDFNLHVTCKLFYFY